LLPACADGRRREFLAQLLETPDYQALHTLTLLDDTASAIAAAAFAEQFAGLKKEDATHPERDALGHELAALRAAGRALAAARGDVDECRAAAAALGLGPGAPGSNDAGAIAALFRRVRGDPVLRRICESAGRYRRLAQSRQRRKAAHGLDDVVGVTLDGEPGRLLPHELARLAVPELELDVLRRLAERQCLAREHQSAEPVGKGPIIVALDESGSMQGAKVETAKALALALAWVARRQRRWCGLVAYSGDSGERLLALPPGRWDEPKLLDWLADFLGCGSSIDVPVREMPRIYAELGAPAGVTDLVFVTDCLCRIPADVRDRFLAWKRSAKARLVTLVIDGEPGDLAAVSDEVHPVRSRARTVGAGGGGGPLAPPHPPPPGPAAPGGAAPTLNPAKELNR
jgi:uncharacterized protein with von Willebrand factor type A (vWA) domain